MGRAGFAYLKIGIYLMKEAGYISEYDAKLGEKIAWVLTGGDLTEPTRVEEQQVLDMEREAFLSLLGERKTQERIQYLLKTGKPLRN
jgi:3-hydroxyacyl-CoA dehydrogenase